MSPRGRRLLQLLRIVFGIALFAWVLSRSGGSLDTDRLLGMGWILVAMASLSFVGALIEALRLRILFGSQGVTLRVRNGFRLVCIGTFFNLFLPGGTGGDLMKLYYIAKENPGRGVETATTLLVDRAVALFALLVLLCCLALANIDLVLEHATLQWLMAATVSGMVGIPLFGLAAASDVVRASRPFVWLTTRPPGHGLILRVADAIHAFVGHFGAVAAAAGVSSVGHFSLSMMFFVIAWGLGAALAPLTAAFLALLGLLANALPFTPGGVGVGEAAFEQLFQLAGYAGGAWLLVMWRVSLLPVAAVGCTLYMLGKRGFTAPPAGVDEDGEGEAAADGLAGPVEDPVSSTSD